MRDDPTHPDPPPPEVPASRIPSESPASRAPGEPLGQVDPRQGESTDTSWVAPDPPPIPDRIRKKVEPRRASLPSLPKVDVKVDHRWLRYGFVGGGAIVLGLVLALWFRASPFDESARAQWQGLCQDYARWFSPLNQSIDYQDKQMLRDAGLGSAVDILADADKFDPRVIAERPGSNLAAIGQQPPPTARTNEAIKATSQAVAALGRVEAVFAKWPTIVNLESHHVMFIDHGWDRAAELVEITLKQAPPYGKAPVGPTLIALQRLEAQTTGIAQAIERLEEELAVLAKHDDPVFDALANAVRELDHQAPTARQPQLLGDDPYTVQLVGLSETLGPLEAFASRFRSLVESDRWATIDHDRFRSEGQAYAMLAQDQHAYSDVFRTWLEEVDGYRGVQEEDWRPAWAQAQREALAPATTSLRTLQAAGHLTAKPLANRIGQLNTRIDAVTNMPLTEGTANELAIQRNVIERDVRDLVTSAGRLDQDVTAQQTAQTLREAKPLIEDAAMRSPAIEKAWQAERQRLADRLERRGDLEAAAADLEAAREVLLSLNRHDSPRGLQAAINFDLAGSNETTTQLLTVLQTRTAEQREATLKLALSDGLPVDESRWAKLRQGYADQIAQAGALANLAQRIEQAMAGAYRLDDPAVSAAEGGLLGETQASLELSLMRDPTVAETARPVLGPVAALGDLNRVDRWDTLTQAAMETRDPAIAFTAWRRMAQVAWPGNAHALDIEQFLQQHLALLTESVRARDEKRADALVAELTAQPPARWLRAMEAARGDEDIAAIAGLADQMKVVAQELPAEARFNLLLYRARSAVASLPTAPGPRRDAEILAMTRAFAQQVRPMADAPPVASLLATLDELTAQTATPREVLAEAGPARRGWVAQAHDDGQAVTFTREGWALTFVRIDPERGDPFYLCTTELSAGLAFDAAAWDDAEGELLAVMPQRGDEDTRKGPRAWAYGESSLTLNPHNWLGESPGYLQDLTPSPPSKSHPINYVSAEGAAYLAARLGCRLPTVAQWKTAMQSYPVPPRSLPNLRDTTWARHAQHTAQLIQAGVPGIDWANSDVFRPAALDANTSADAVGDFHPINDTTLWFSPSPQHDDGSASPVDLVGNVAELVTLTPIDPDTLLDGSQPIAERRDAFRQAHKQAFAVIGGSALSPASLNPTAPQPFNVFSGAKGYADVGVRLAFDVPFVSPARQAESALRQQPFIQP